VFIDKLSAYSLTGQLSANANKAVSRLKVKHEKLGITSITSKPAGDFVLNIPHSRFNRFTLTNIYLHRLLRKSTCVGILTVTRATKKRHLRFSVCEANENNARVHT
jgi:hypothetical protein